MSNILKDTLKINNKYDCKVALIDVKFKNKVEKDKPYATYKFFTINPAFVNYMTEELDDVKLLHLDKALPMIMKPANWTSYDIGGLLPKAHQHGQNLKQQRTTRSHKARRS